MIIKKFKMYYLSSNVRAEQISEEVFVEIVNNL